jgi:transcriptional regulator with XRE-family HTH domain
MKKVVLSKVLKSLLQERNISVRALSRELKIPQSTLNSIVSGKQPGSIEQLLVLAQYFGVSLEYLATGEDSEHPTLGEVLTEAVYDGWLKVKIERAIPNRRKPRGNL